MHDVSLVTATVEEHLRSTASASDTFYSADARLKRAKYQFDVRESEILGHKIDCKGIGPSETYFPALLQLVEPGRGEELMRFLELFIFFAGFIDHFSQMAKSVHTVLVGKGLNMNKKKGDKLIIPDLVQRWEWKQKGAWAALKMVLRNPGFLVAPRRSVSKRLKTDGSAYGIVRFLLL